VDVPRETTHALHPWLVREELVAGGNELNQLVEFAPGG